MGRKEKESDWILIDQLADIILENVQGCVVDIGIGASTLVLAKHAKKYSRSQYSCDISSGRCAWARKLEWPIIYEMPSVEFIKQFPENEKVALVFLDGEHLAETVLIEVNFFYSKMLPGGIMFLHDTYPKPGYIKEDGGWCGTVYRARLELETDSRFDCLTFPYTGFNYGITMLIKKDLNQPFYRR